MNEVTNTYRVRRDEGPDYRFKGERLARVYTSSDKARSDYSGVTGRSSELILYKTEAGKYVAQRIGHTQWQGEHDRYEAQLCEHVDELFAFFGGGRLAKELYDEAGIAFIVDLA